MASSNSGGAIWWSGFALFLANTHSYTDKNRRLQIVYPITTLGAYVGSINWSIGALSSTIGTITSPLHATDSGKAQRWAKRRSPTRDASYPQFNDLREHGRMWIWLVFHLIHNPTDAVRLNRVQTRTRYYYRGSISICIHLWRFPPSRTMRELDI